MALVIEDGSIVENANSYATDTEFVAYAKERGLTIPSTSSDRSILLVLAKDYIDGLKIQGKRTDPDNQYLSFPRYDVYAFDRCIASDEIPKEWKWAQMEAAIAAHTQSLMVNESQQNIQSEKMDVLQVSYFSGGSWSKVRLGRVMNYAKPFLTSNLALQRA